MKVESLLSFDTALDARIHRPPARWMARKLARTGVSPNLLTLCSLVPAAAAAGCFWRGTFAAVVLGIGLFYVWAVADHVDGEVARMTGRTSDWGRKLDDTCDEIATFLILTGIFAGAAKYWAREWRLVFGSVFVASALVNALSSQFLIWIRREVRKQEIERQAADSGFIQSQKTIDLFAGRDPFYALLAVHALFVCAGGWLKGLLAVLLPAVLCLNALGSAVGSLVTRQRRAA